MFVLLFLLVLVLSFLVFFILALIAPLASIDKLVAYECGFLSFTFLERKASFIHYYRVAVLFLLFDVEVLLLLPFAVVVSFLTPLSFLVFIVFLLLLLLTLLYELFFSGLLLKIC